MYGFSSEVHGNMAFPAGESSARQVLERRALFLRTLFPSSPPPPLFTVTQVHGNRFVIFDDDKEYSPVPVADAVITGSNRVVLGVLTADCLPIILYSRASTGVGVIHAGRAGSFNMVTGIAVTGFLDYLGISPADVFAVIGPGILGCCYKVREDALKPFEKSGLITKAVSKVQAGQWRVDLELLNVMQIQERGVPPENIFRLGVCTMCGSGYFSFRRDGTKNRFLSVVSLAG